eukprot:CAMPEP_0184392714 /NCGR_PEP_ID=MMETSP0007-20130409/29277_1 /TAXON_ID=97485 /ORGANISM="Prymnesium parvum, Strain Texoma1" /LENGTH=103 /DNA_ID=CAMNT_0026743387 /DNA_START=515 /DNA_END=824 /DNA_ORIENTATION=+
MTDLRVHARASDAAASFPHGQRKTFLLRATGMDLTNWIARQDRRQQVAPPLHNAADNIPDGGWRHPFLFTPTTEGVYALTRKPVGGEAVAHCWEEECCESHAI